MGEIDWNEGLLEFRASSSRAFGDYTDDYQYMQSWSVDALLVDGEEPEVVLHRMGTANLTFVDVDGADKGGARLFDLFDESNWDITHLGEALLLHGLLDELVEEPVDSERGLLLLEKVFVEPPYRGVGLGPLLAAVALTELRRGCTVAACHPAPFDPEVVADEARRQVEIERLERIWATVGFRPMRMGVWTLHLFTDLDSRRVDLDQSFRKRSGS